MNGRNPSNVDMALWAVSRLTDPWPSNPFSLQTASASDDMTIKLWDWDKGWDCTQVRTLLSWKEPETGMVLPIQSDWTGCLPPQNTDA